MKRLNWLSLLLGPAILGLALILGWAVATSKIRLVLPVVGLLVVPLILRYRYALFVGFIFLLPFPDISLAPFVTMKAFLAGMLVAIALLSKGAATTPLVRVRGFHTVLLLFVLIAGMTFLAGRGALTPTESGQALWRLVGLFNGVLTYFALALNWDYVQRPAIKLVSAVGGAFVALLTIFEEQALRAGLGTLFFATQELPIGRSGGVFGNPNFAGLYLAGVLALVLVEWLQNRRQWWWLPIGGAVAAGLAVTLSRGAIFALAATLALFLLIRSRSWWGRFLFVAGLIWAIPRLVTVLIPVFVQYRLSVTYGAYNDAALSALADSDYLRSLMVSSAVQMFIDSPLTGLGFGTFTYLSGHFNGTGMLLNSHNLYLQVLGEMGLVGCLLFAGVAYYPLMHALRAVRSLNSKTLAFAVPVLVFFVDAISINPLENLQVMGFYWLAIAGVLTADHPLVTKEPATGEMRLHSNQLLHF